jgi:toxin ParE1/3/4
MRLVRSGTYRADLENIADYIARENPSAALAVWDEIESQVERLREYPHSGRSGRLKGTRELIVTGTPFVVVYAVKGTVTLLRVVHGAQRWPEKPGRLR